MSLPETGNWVASPRQTSGSGDAERCRLCGGETREVFSLSIFGQVPCAYLLCRECESLQTEWPTWTDHAYQSSLTHLDTGAANRCLLNRSHVYFLSRILGVRSVLDFGGGDGLLTRLLRDVELDCRVLDKFAAPTYAAPFKHQPEDRYDLVCAFEVIEHLVEPGNELTALFGPARQHLLISTALYKGQDKNWWYLAPMTGQHIFFYSKKAIELIGQRFHYTPTFFGDYVLFSRRKLRVLEHLVLRLVFAPIIRRALCAYIELKSKTGVRNDFERLAAEGSERSR